METKGGLAQHLRGWLFASPYIIFTIIFFIIPLVWSLILVFHQWNLISPVQTFVGLQNFREAFGSGRVRAAFIVTYQFMLAYVPAVVMLSIGLAMIVHSLPRFKQFFAVGFFLPYLASGVAVGRVVLGLIAHQSPVNQIFRDVIGTTPNWLGNPRLAMLVISAMLVWKMSGYYSLIFLAGLQGIPEPIYEAARIDGASPWRQFWSITFPLLYPSLYTVLILAVGITFAIFTEPFVLTGGGPALATHTWQIEIYYQAFDRFRAGYASSVAILNALVTFISILIIRHAVTLWGARYGFEQQ
jgi:multiple sugar transport system permease protein